MKGGNSEPNRESRPDQLSMDRNTNLCRFVVTDDKPTKAIGLVQHGHGETNAERICKGWTQHFVIQTAPQSNPANSKVLNSTANEVSERWKDPSALQNSGVGVNRMLEDGLRDCLRSQSPWESQVDMLT